jgi:hypothetical protein
LDAACWVTPIRSAECDAEWADDAASRRKVWDLFATAEEPLGYDPRGVLGMTDQLDPGITVLRMTPWRLSTLTESWQRPEPRLTTRCPR